MNAEAHAGTVDDLNEGSWVYLSLRSADQRLDRDLHQRVIEACEASGWASVSWFPPPHRENLFDSGRFFEGMSHAVEHADAIVVLLNSPSALTDVELAFAYSHNRPVIALRIGDQGGSSEVQAMLRRHDRAHVIDRADMEECVAGLRSILSDPQFGAMVRTAASEQASLT
jgi:hypothetical protein